MNKLAVIALGGNALLRGDQDGTIEEQEQNTTETLENLIFLIKEGYDLVISHGNGPQVGNILLRNDAGEQVYNIPQMPVEVCFADSQASWIFCFASPSSLFTSSVKSNVCIPSELATIMVSAKIHPLSGWLFDVAK